VCGKKYLCRRFTHDKPKTAEGIFKPLCPDCFAEKRRRAEEEKVAKENEIARQEREKEHKEFVKRLENWRAVPLEKIRPNNGNVLYVLGNGFDLMHRVPSSYYNFRDSLGKNNDLRQMLENYITVEDCWADLEYALAHINVSAMSNMTVVDTFLDINDAYNEDSGAAEYFMSVEEAAMPMQIIATELPRRFRKWVDTLKVGTYDRPLNDVFRNGKVLCFNYTEFVESMYNIPKQNVCYIHGCRVKEKGKPREPLILGHMLGASDSSFEFEEEEAKYLGGYRRAYAEIARTQVIDYISEYDEDLTKDTAKIINNHEKFFSELKNTETVVVVGHSYSETDFDYFEKIKASTLGNVKWYFGCYGLRDIINLENLLQRLQIRESEFKIFRTDVIRTYPLSSTETPKKENPNKVVYLCKSQDGRWSVERNRNEIMISDLKVGIVDYRAKMSDSFSRAFFIANGKYLLAVTCCQTPGVIVFRKEDEHWKLTGELHCDHQHLLVQRLKHVFVDGDEIAFVYNNRIRKYSLLNAKQIYNNYVANAKSLSYAGEDIIKNFR
ncbi:MAG: bacteriophage abortive infection AbiH family protein, partial [Clostridia bacterium]|nr:bacteriophage abortive infection AbiH family protein [Clostridia bacterium]